MARKLLGLLIASVFTLGYVSSVGIAGGDALKKELAQLNLITGSDGTRVVLKKLIDNPAHAKSLIALALPAAEKKEISYNAAMVLGLASAELKDLKSAEVFFTVGMEQARKLQSPNKLAQTYRTMARLYYFNKNYADCIRICRKLLELNTDDGIDRKVIGTAPEEEYAKPRPSFDTAENVRPEIFEYYVKATAKQGKHDQAVKLVDNRLKNNDNWFDRQLKGWVLHEAGKYQDAADVYETIIKEVSEVEGLKPKFRDDYLVELRYDVSNVYTDFKKIDKVSEHLEWIIKKRPSDPRAYNDLGYILADNNLRLEEAEKMIRKAIDLDRAERKKDPDFDPKTDRDRGAYLDSLGWALFKLKKNQEAKEWLIKATGDKDAQHLEIYDHLGDVHMVLGERDLAIKAWTEGLKHITDSRRDQERKAAVEKKIEKAKAK